MPTVTETTLSDIVDSTMSAIVAENILDAAANKITAHGYAIGNLTGTAGSKSKSVTQAELGWLQTVAIAIYAKDYKQGGANSQSTGLGNLSTVTSAGDSDALAEQAAKQLNQTDWNRAFI